METVSGTPDPLSRLVVDEAAVNRELLARVLENRIRLDMKAGAFSFLPGVRERMNTRHQVLIALLAQKAMHLLNAKLQEGLRPQEIEFLTGVKGGTLRPVLKILVEKRLVRPESDKSYTVPGYAVEDAATFLSDRGD